MAHSLNAAVSSDFIALPFGAFGSVTSSWVCGEELLKSLNNLSSTLSTPAFPARLLRSILLVSSSGSNA